MNVTIFRKPNKQRKIFGDITGLTLCMLTAKLKDIVPMADGKACVVRLLISQVTSNTDQCVNLAMSFQNKHIRMSALCKETRNRAGYISRLHI